MFHKVGGAPHFHAGGSEAFFEEVTRGVMFGKVYGKVAGSETDEEGTEDEDAQASGTVHASAGGQNGL